MQAESEKPKTETAVAAKREEMPEIVSFECGSKY